MVTKNQIKLIKSLHDKKSRALNRLFIAEGEKTIGELVSENLNLVNLYCSSPIGLELLQKPEEISVSEMAKMSALKNPSGCLGVFEFPVPKPINRGGISVLLDGIGDPGNLGTIIRLCDWFGIESIICSEDSVDAYNPKTVQATMGSIARVSMHYVNLEKYLENETRPIFGAFMEGNNLFESNLPSDAVIVFGSESHGISAKLENLVNQKISIPRQGNIRRTESLNVATAAAIVISEFFRN